MAKETAAYTANGEPKYPFVGRIVEAYYTNADLTEIDIIHNYDVPDDGSHTNGGKEGTTVFSVSVDETDERFLALLQEFSYESLDECTRNRNEAYREQFRQAFQDYAQRNQVEIFEEVIVKKEESLMPKVSAVPKKDGSITSMPLEDMSPLLDLENLKDEMLIDLLQESYEVRS